MKNLVAAVAFAVAALIAVPTFIQCAAAAESTEVYMGGKYIGQDPDANVRLQLRRDAGSENF
jgi:hypothetical protein